MGLMLPVMLLFPARIFLCSKPSCVSVLQGRVPGIRYRTCLRVARGGQQFFRKNLVYRNAVATMFFAFVHERIGTLNQ